MICLHLLRTNAAKPHYCLKNLASVSESLCTFQSVMLIYLLSLEALNCAGLYVEWYFLVQKERGRGVIGRPDEKQFCSSHLCKEYRSFGQMFHLGIV